MGQFYLVKTVANVLWFDSEWLWPIGDTSATAGDLLSGKAAVVTGAASGNGRAIAH